MPAAKSNRAAQGRYQQKNPLRTRARTFVKSARRDIEEGNLEAAEQSVRRAVVALDKAASRGALHPKNAARRKSRMMSQLSRARNA
ncbi:MAG: 30S ribosomal protein S20 [Dehalococcoidia bacterium]|nr:30S ribosomal protein S20 [Dehalococcoidia bacterium]